MKLIIAGSRDYIFTPSEIYKFLEFFDIKVYSITQVVSGAANGVDKSGEKFAHAYIGDKKDYLKQFKADWDKHGKVAGPIRNEEMAYYGDALLLIWDGKSPGSRNMLMKMTALDKPVYEIIIRTHNES